MTQLAGETTLSTAVLKTAAEQLSEPGSIFEPVMAPHIVNPICQSEGFEDDDFDEDDFDDDFDDDFEDEDGYDHSLEDDEEEEEDDDFDD